LFIPDFLPIPDPEVKKAPDPRYVTVTLPFCFVLTINVPVVYMRRDEYDFDVGNIHFEPFGPKWHSLRSWPCHFRARKSLDFQGPPLPMALEMDVGHIKIILSLPI
jgi:hypothetical protein